MKPRPGPQGSAMAWWCMLVLANPNLLPFPSLLQGKKIGIPRHTTSKALPQKTASEWRHLWPHVTVLLEDSDTMNFWLPQIQTIKTQNVCSFFSGSMTPFVTWVWKP